ncbi:MAG: RodZ domain-containing protein [Pseudomonadota bacterium]
MEDKHRLSDDNELPVQQGSGSLLATARKQQQKTIEEIADELNLSVSQLKTIELDQTEGLPEPTYVRGYIRAYAKLLGLDPDDVLKNYLNPNWKQGSNLNDIPRGIGATQEPESGFLSPAKALISLALVAAIGFLWYSGSFPNLFAERESSTAVPQSSDNPYEGNAPAAANPVPTNVETIGQENENLLGAEQEGAAETSVNESEKNTDPAPAHVLSLRFSETSWVDIRDDQDNRLAYKSYAEGELLNVDSESTMSVFIGNAAGVTVEYNGQPFDLSEHREGVYAKFVVGD